MSIDPTFFRHVMRRYATGVAILTVRNGDRLHGMTANSFTSVSLDPLLVLVCILRASTTHEMVTQSGAFAVNFVGEAQVELARRFAKQTPVPPEPFGDIAFHAAVTGAPIFDDGLGYVDCRVASAHLAGDHSIFVGEVLATGIGTTKSGPLIWFDGAYHSLEVQ